MARKSTAAAATTDVVIESTPVINTDALKTKVNSISASITEALNKPDNAQLVQAAKIGAVAGGAAAITVGAVNKVLSWF